ncbi:hypothetical protein TNCT_238381 [Trichonephila clavata]|uniref:Uncharacterized protein n=1 Tax=Trichonephila clavata TaxID=2740835 RepID=A0A8X6G8Q0_TRICU|nr:hypothetical protein TNCT_238381 [Trichonephila clavata]
MFHKPPQRLDGGDIGGPSRDHPNARLVGSELCSESFHSTENVMLRLNQCFAYTPPRPDGRVMVDHAAFIRTQRCWVPELCSESFNNKVNVIPLRTECFANPPP